MNLEHIKKYLDDKFNNLSVPTKTRPQITLKAKGNQAQADFVIDVLTKLDVANDKLNVDNKEEATAQINEAIKLLNKRLKLIKIADKSDYGWQTVIEYMSDEVASGSEDERRIRRAESVVEKKRKKAQSGTTAKKTKFLEDEHVAQTAQDRQFFRSSGTRFFQRRTQRPRLPGANDRCFGCGKQGHWRYQCYKIAATSDNHAELPSENQSFKSSPRRC